MDPVAEITALVLPRQRQDVSSPTKDKMWNRYRVKSTSGDEKGALIGKYRRRGDAKKVVAEMAYQTGPKW